MECQLVSIIKVAMGNNNNLVTTRVCNKISKRNKDLLVKREDIIRAEEKGLKVEQEITLILTLAAMK